MSNALSRLAALDDQLKGILFITFAMTLITIQDMIIKSISETYPLHQIVFTRACVAIVITIGLVKIEGGFANLKTKRPVLHVFRGFLVVGANMMYFLGLATMSVPEAMSIFFVAPLFITVLSIPFLGEEVGIRRWFAVIAGLLGVGIMLRPGAGVFEYAALLPVIAALCYATLQITTRRMGVTEKASTMSFYIQLVFICVSGGIGLIAGDGRYAGGGHPSVEFLLRAWVMPPTIDMVLMLTCGLIVGISGYCMVQSYRIAKATTVAPFEYVALPMAVFWTYILWGDLPDWITVLGIFLVAGSGIFVFYRESVKGRQVAVIKPGPRHR